MSGFGDELYDVISAIYEKNGARSSISPTWMATEAMDRIAFPRKLHPLGYGGCHMQLRQIARSFCRRKFAPADDRQDDIPELFSGKLQERYPTRGRAGEEAQYVLLDDLTDPDVDFNIARLGRASLAFQQHSDALLAWSRNRRRSHDATS